MRMSNMTKPRWMAHHRGKGPVIVSVPGLRCCVYAHIQTIGGITRVESHGSDVNSDAGLYVMNLTNAVPRETDTSLVRHLTMIIVRVGRVGAKKQKYMWMVGTLCSDI